MDPARARGGLLKLLKIYFALPLESLSVADFWTALHQPAADTHAFKTGFHIVVGLLTAVFHVFGLEPILSGPALVKGLVYSLLVWLTNAFIVLPRIGEGSAGSRYLSAAGMTYFAAAHTLFSGCSRCSTRASCDETRRRAPLLLTSRPDWAAFIASLFAPAPREKP